MGDIPHFSNFGKWELRIRSPSPSPLAFSKISEEGGTNPPYRGGHLGLASLAAARPDLLMLCKKCTFLRFSPDLPQLHQENLRQIIKLSLKIRFTFAVMRGSLYKKWVTGSGEAHIVK